MRIRKDSLIKCSALSILLYMSIVIVFVMLEILQGYTVSWTHFCFSSKNVYLPYMYIFVSSILFFILLVVFEGKKQNAWKFYLLFYTCWVFFIILLSSFLYTYFELVHSDEYGKNLLENDYILERVLANIFDFFAVGLLYNFLAIPHNLMVFIVSFFLLRIYVK